MKHTVRFVRPTNREELLPCPFCGNDEVVYEQYMLAGSSRWRVICCGCMATIDPGYAQQMYQVAEMWNKRQGGEKE